VPKWYIVSIKPNGPEFEVLSFDPNTKLGKLRGRMGTAFVYNLGVEELKKLGYKLEKREVQNVQQGE